MKNKLKTRKIVTKRFKVTKSGKILRRAQNMRHLRRKKGKKQIRKYRGFVPGGSEKYSLEHIHWGPTIPYDPWKP